MLVLRTLKQGMSKYSGTHVNKKKTKKPSNFFFQKGTKRRRNPVLLQHIANATSNEPFKLPLCDSLRPRKAEVENMATTNT